jgi:hypothetical protein
MNPWAYVVGAVAGGVAGGYSTWLQGEEEKDRLGYQKEQAWEKYLLGAAYSNRLYDINRREAQTGLAIQRRRLDENVDQGIGRFNTGLLAQAYGIQNARIQTASGIGASRAAEGAGGTRGNGANELARAYEQTSLDRNVDLQYRQNGQALAGMLSQANNAAADIRRESASWDPGGYRYESKAAQDSYNRNMALLGQSEFDWAIRDAEPTWLDYATNIFNGASTGIGMVSSFGSAFNFSGGSGGNGSGGGNGSAGSGGDAVSQFNTNAAFRNTYSGFSARSGPLFDTYNYGFNFRRDYTSNLNMDFWD